MFIGFSTLAVLAGYTNPGTGYELSVYHGVPPGFGLTLVVSVFDALLTPTT